MAPPDESVRCVSVPYQYRDASVGPRRPLYLGPLLPGGDVQNHAATAPDSTASASYRYDDPRGPTVMIALTAEGLEITLDDRTLVSMTGRVPLDGCPAIMALAAAARRTVSAP